jgi:hypothetical protein
MDQLLGEQNAARLRYRNRRGSDVLAKQPPQLSGADAQPVGKAFNVILVETASFDQAERA